MIPGDVLAKSMGLSAVKEMLRSKTGRTELAEVSGELSRYARGAGTS